VRPFSISAWEASFFLFFLKNETQKRNQKSGSLKYLRRYHHRSPFCHLLFSGLQKKGETKKERKKRKCGTNHNDDDKNEGTKEGRKSYNSCAHPETSMALEKMAAIASENRRLFALFFAPHCWPLAMKRGGNMLSGARSEEEEEGKKGREANTAEEVSECSR